MKRLFVFLFLSAQSIMVWAVPMPISKEVRDTVFELGPEEKPEYYEKSLLFCKLLLNYLNVFHRDDILESPKDSIIIDFRVNAKGFVDSVWLVSPRGFAFENTYKFIKGYDFKGPLMEYYYVSGRYVHTVRVLIFLDRKRQYLYVHSQITHSKKEEEHKRKSVKK